MDKQPTPEVTIIKGDDGKIYERVVAQNTVSRKQITDAIQSREDNSKQLADQLGNNAAAIKSLEDELAQFDAVVPPVKKNRMTRRKDK